MPTPKPTIVPPAAPAVVLPTHDPVVAVRHLTVRADYHEQKLKELERRVQIAESYLRQIITHGDVIAEGSIPTAVLPPRIKEIFNFDPSEYQQSVFLLLPVSVDLFDDLSAWAAEQEDCEDVGPEQDVIDFAVYRPQKQAMIARLRAGRAA